MSKSSKLAPRSKDAKPHPDFPLFRHASGRWCKKVKGKFCYFGKTTDDPQGEKALDLWLEQKDDLLAGRKPRTAAEKAAEAEGMTIRRLCNHFLTFKKGLLESGGLAQRTFDRYYATCELLVKILGAARMVDDLRQEDFAALRKKMAAKWGPVALGNEIQMVRSVFRYGFDAELMDRPVRFGPGFKKPSAKVLRTTRAKAGRQMFEAEEIRALLDAARPNIKAMILLAINGGLGNTDVALLTVDACDLKRGWLDYPRTKTGVPRRIPLWSETVEAIKAVVAKRPQPKDADHGDLLFISGRGESYIGKHKGYRVVGAFGQVLKDAKLDGKGLSFYDLRRTFQTIAENAKDLSAVQSIMGHAAAATDMSARYRQRVDDERLLAVVNCVRAWLFSSEINTDDGKR